MTLRLTRRATLAAAALPAFTILPSGLRARQLVRTLRNSVEAKSKS